MSEAQPPQQQAPFIPSSVDEEPIPAKPGQVFRVPGFPRLFAAQVVSSIGDWTAVLAIILLASNVSTNAVGLVMIARMLPGVLLAPLGGALVDRWNRKVVMVSADVGRAALLVVLPFWDTLLGLVVISFSIEVLTLLWGPAKDATVPNIVKDPELLPAANSLGMLAAWGTFPIGAMLFALMAAVSSWVSSFSAVSPFRPEQASLAIWVDSITFLVSALLISGLRMPTGNAKGHEKPKFSQTWSDMIEGLRFIRSAPLVRGVMIGLAGGLIGGGSMIPLGAVFTTDALGLTPSSYGFLTTSLGLGAAAGVVTLLAFQRRLPRPSVFFWSVLVAGFSIAIMAWVTTLAFAIVLIALVGAGAGCAYVTGFTLLQESVSDEMRGRTFATLYTVVRVCLLFALTIGPFAAGGLDALSENFADGAVDIGTATLTLPGVRLALFLGGCVTVASGFAARRRMRKAAEDASAL